MDKNIELFKEKWYERYPAHENNADTGEDMFWQTAELVAREYVAALQPSTLPLIEELNLNMDARISLHLEKEPVNFFLHNILRYLSQENMKILSDNLIARLPKSVPLIHKGEQSVVLTFDDLEKAYDAGVKRGESYISGWGYENSTPGWDEFIAEYQSKK